MQSFPEIAPITFSEIATDTHYCDI